jgi:hypothetical protein
LLLSFLGSIVISTTISPCEQWLAGGVAVTWHPLLACEQVAVAALDKWQHWVWSRNSPCHPVSSSSQWCIVFKSPVHRTEKRP